MDITAKRRQIEQNFLTIFYCSSSVSADCPPLSSLSTSRWPQFVILLSSARSPIISIRLDAVESARDATEVASRCKRDAAIEQLSPSSAASIKGGVEFRLADDFRRNRWLTAFPVTMGRSGYLSFTSLSGGTLSVVRSTRIAVAATLRQESKQVCYEYFI